MADKEHRQQCFSYHESILKRCLDILLCCVFFVPTALVVLVILFVVLCVDGRPVLFFQKRVGKDSKCFIMPKIRTLKTYAHHSKPACSYDINSFATRTGRFLRKYRLDELPQVFCVIAGKMSFVGPRPELPHIVDKYSTKEYKRLCVKPGITGIWQIKAPRNCHIHKNIKYDLYYVRKAGFWMDVKVLIGTVFFIFKPDSRTLYEKNRLYTCDLSMPK